MDKANLMRLAYDRDSDVLYLSVGEPRPAISREIGDDVLLRVRRNGASGGHDDSQFIDARPTLESAD